MKQGAVLNVNGIAVIANIQSSGDSGDWIMAELYEAPAARESGKGVSWELEPIRAKIRVANGNTPTEGSLIEIRGGALNRSKGEYQGKEQTFWNVTVFTWRELDSAPAAQKGNQPANGTTVTPKPTTSRPVMDDPTPVWEDESDVPF